MAELEALRRENEQMKESMDQLLAELSQTEISSKGLESHLRKVDQEYEGLLNDFKRYSSQTRELLAKEQRLEAVARNYKQATLAALRDPGEAKRSLDEIRQQAAALRTQLNRSGN